MTKDDSNKNNKKELRKNKANGQMAIDKYGVNENNSPEYFKKTFK